MAMPGERPRPAVQCKYTRCPERISASSTATACGSPLRSPWRRVRLLSGAAGWTWTRQSRFSGAKRSQLCHSLVGYVSLPTCSVVSRPKRNRFVYIRSSSNMDPTCLV